MIEVCTISGNILKGIVTSYCVAAGLVTVFRFSVRSPKKWWWDELCTFLVLLAMVLQAVVLWLRVDGYPSLIRNDTAMIAIFYLNSVCFYIEDWGARCAILFSIIRITSDERVKRYLKIVAFGFFTLFCVNVALLIGSCEENPKWHALKPPRCLFSQSVPIFRIVTGILSDSLLVIIPIYNLKQLKTASGLHRTLFIIFGSSAWLTAACIAQAVVNILMPGDPTLVATMTEGFIALLLCNLSVVAIAVINLCGYNRTSVRQTSGSFQLSTGFYMHTIEENPRETESLRKSVGSLEIAGNGGGISGATGFLTRWRTMDIDADNPSRAASNERASDKGAAQR